MTREQELKKEEATLLTKAVEEEVKFTTLSSDQRKSR